VEQWRGGNNPQRLWIIERLEKDSESKVTLDAAYADYRQWSRDNGHYEAAKNVFARQVNKLVDNVKDGRNHTVYRGFRLADPGSGPFSPVTDKEEMEK